MHEKSSTLWNDLRRAFAQQSTPKFAYPEAPEYTLLDLENMEPGSTSDVTQLWQGTKDYRESFFANSSTSYSFGRLSLFNQGDMLQG